MVVGYQRYVPTVLLQGRDKVPITQEAGWAQGRSGRVWNTSPPSGFNPRTVQPVDSSYPGLPKTS